jgi:hypothetical protein
MTKVTGDVLHNYQLVRFAVRSVEFNGTHQPHFGAVRLAGRPVANWYNPFLCSSLTRSNSLTGRRSTDNMESVRYLSHVVLLTLTAAVGRALSSPSKSDIVKISSSYNGNERQLIDSVIH